MESVVEDVEDERQTEGSPANSQCCQYIGGCDDMRISLSVNHSDGPSSCSSLYQGQYCQTERISSRGATCDTLFSLSIDDIFEVTLNQL